MSDLNRHLIEIENSLKYIAMNATVLTRFASPPDPNPSDREILDYYRDTTNQNIIDEASKDLMGAIDDLRGEIDSLRRSIDENNNDEDSAIVTPEIAEKFNNLLDS